MKGRAYLLARWLLVPVVFYLIPLVTTLVMSFIWQAGWFIIPNCEPVIQWSVWEYLPWCPQEFFHRLLDLIRSAVWGITGVWAAVRIAPSHKKPVAIVCGIGTVVIYIGFNIISTPSDFRISDWVDHSITAAFGLIIMWYFMVSLVSDHPQEEK